MNEPSQRTTISLPRSLARRLSLEARASKKPVSAVVRDALQAHLKIQKVELPAFTGIGDSGRSDVSENIEVLIRRRVPRRR